MIDQIGDPVHLVGHFFGGVVSLRTAMDNQSQLRSLMLIEPVAAWLMEGDDDLAPYIEFRDRRDEFHKWVEQGDIDAAVKESTRIITIGIILSGLPNIALKN